jgi:uncharacterized protein YcfJ
LIQPEGYLSPVEILNLLLQHNTTNRSKTMESIRTASRIHPLMAAAAASVIMLSVAGTAAITGLLPTSHSEPAPALSSTAPLASLPPAQYAVAPEPAPVVHHAAPRPKTVQHARTVAQNEPSYRAADVQPAPAPAPAPKQPNYVGIGVGAVVGGLLGNQVGSGNGRKLATVAGVIGGGMLGNEVANRNK